MFLQVLSNEDTSKINTFFCGASQTVGQCDQFSEFVSRFFLQNTLGYSLVSTVTPAAFARLFSVLQTVQTGG